MEANVLHDLSSLSPTLQAIMAGSPLFIPLAILAWELWVEHRKSKDLPYPDQGTAGMVIIVGGILGYGIEMLGIMILFLPEVATSAGPFLGFAVMGSAAIYCWSVNVITFLLLWVLSQSWSLLRKAVSVRRRMLVA